MLKRITLLLKEYNDEFFIRYGLILDTYINSISEDLFEDAVSIAASFMSAQKEQDILLDLMFIGNKSYRFTSGRGLGSAENIPEVLACIQPTYKSNISDLEGMINNYSHECSGLICIILKLDDERRHFLNSISNYNIPVKLLLVSETDELDKTGLPESVEIQLIRQQHLQNDLNKLN